MTVDLVEDGSLRLDALLDLRHDIDGRLVTVGNKDLEESMKWNIKAVEILL